MQDKLKKYIVSIFKTLNLRSGKIFAWHFVCDRDEKSIQFFSNNHLLRIHGRVKDGVLVEHMGLRERWRFAFIGAELYEGSYIPRISVNSKSCYVLGIAGTDYDSTAALYKNGVLLFAQEEERFSRAKHDTSLIPVNSIRWMLKQENIHLNDISHIVIARDFNLFRDTTRTLAPALAHYEKLDEEYAILKGYPKGTKISRRPICERDKKRYDYLSLQEHLSCLASEEGIDPSVYLPSISFVPHHLAHAASAYYASGFSEPTLVVTLDGHGDLETSTAWLGQNGRLEKIDSITVPHSLGSLWGRVAKYLGFGSHQQGELMGLSAYGFPRDLEESLRVSSLISVLSEEIKLLPQGKFSINSELIYHELGEMGGLTKRFTLLFEKLVPQPRKSSQDIDPEKDRAIANFAYALQQKTDDIILHRITYFLRHNPKTNKIKYLAMAGGVALNIVSTNRIISEGLVDRKNIFVPPTPSDSGTALGAAMIISHRIFGFNLSQKMDHAYYGPSTSEDEIQQTLERFGLVEGQDFKRLTSEEEIARFGSEKISEGRSLAWFQGRSELGPRSLMNRSLLFNLSDPESNEKANRAKGRQKWRPSAISLLDEAASEIFDNVHNASFMVVSAPVRKEKQDIICSGIHVDGTTRPQIVTKSANPLAWLLLKILKEDKKIVGVVNTSFNKKEPIVESPEEALNTFYYMKDIDILMLGSYVIYRPTKWKPSILSLEDEPKTSSLLRNVAKNAGVVAWFSIFELINVDEIAPNQVFLIFRTSWTTERYPLLKEMFHGHYQSEILNFLLLRIDSLLKECEASKLFVECTSNKMAPVLKKSLMTQLKNRNLKNIVFS